MRLQILLQDTTRLDEQAAIDRLVRHPISLVIRIGALQPPGNLLGRPIIFKLGSDHLPQLIMPCQLARLWSKCSIPRTLVRSCRAIPARTAIALQLAADRRWCAPKAACNRPERYASSD